MRPRGLLLPRLCIYSQGEYVPLSLAASLSIYAASALALFSIPQFLEHVSDAVTPLKNRIAAAVAALLKSKPKNQRRSTMSVLREVREAGVIGLDVGGTLAKLVIAEPARSSNELPEAFGEDGDDGQPEGRTHRTLDLRLRPRYIYDDELNDGERRLQFMSGSSDGLAQLLETADGGVVTPRTPAKSDGSASSSGSNQPPGGSFGVDAIERAAKQKAKRVAATGGGAHKLKGLMAQAFNIELQPVPEMESVILGMLSLHALNPPGELFTVENNAGVIGDEGFFHHHGLHGEPGARDVAWPEKLFPFLLVNIGSGVSVLRVDGLRPPAVAESGLVDNFSSQVVYTRVGGTACGGATFLGLAKLLTHRPDMSFEEALLLASRGDSSAVDKVVGDIYGEDGSASLGLPASLTAASFGKLVTPPPPSSRSMSPAPSIVSSRVSSRKASKPASPRQMRRSELMKAERVSGGGAPALPSSGLSLSVSAEQLQQLADAAPLLPPPAGKSSSAPPPGKSSSDESKKSRDSRDRGERPSASAGVGMWPPPDADVIAALLDMVVQASAVLAKAHVNDVKGASASGGRVFFSGGFVSANPLARAALARSLRALGCEALFFRHSDFLGALGALARSWPGGADAFRRDWTTCAEDTAPELDVEMQAEPPPSFAPPSRDSNRSSQRSQSPVAFTRRSRWGGLEPSQRPHGRAASPPPPSIAAAPYSSTITPSPPPQGGPTPPYKTSPLSERHHFKPTAAAPPSRPPSLLEKASPAAVHRPTPTPPRRTQAVAAADDSSSQNGANGARPPTGASRKLEPGFKDEDRRSEEEEDLGMV